LLILLVLVTFTSGEMAAAVEFRHCQWRDTAVDTDSISSSGGSDTCRSRDHVTCITSTIVSKCDCSVIGSIVRLFSFPLVNAKAEYDKKKPKIGSIEAPHTIGLPGQIGQFHLFKTGKWRYF